MKKLLHGFPRLNRLTKARDYSRVMQKRAQYRVSSSGFMILARDSEEQEPRLGLIVAKKQLRKATKRNLAKRLIRESFRHNKSLLAHLDVVVLVNKKLESLDNKQFLANLDESWVKLSRLRKN